MIEDIEFVSIEPLEKCNIEDCENRAVWKVGNTVFCGQHKLDLERFVNTIRQHELYKRMSRT